MKIASSLILILMMLSSCAGSRAVENTAPAAGETPNQQASSPAPANFKTTLIGKIDGRYDIRMDLERAGDKLTGTYFYDRPGAMSVAVKYIALEGSTDQAGNVTLTETAYDSEKGEELKTGEFKGKLSVATINGGSGLQFTGSWTRAKDKKSLPFSLQERRYEMGAGVKLVEQKQVDENKKGRYEIELRLPNLSGADPARAENFNKVVNGLIAGEVNEFKKTMAENAKDAVAANTTASESAKADDAPKGSLEIGHSVTAANQDFVSVLMTSMSYTGGAHPNTITKALNYDLKRGQPVALADLFLPNSNYLKLISSYCVAELKKLKIGDQGSISAGAAAKLDNYKSWNITPQGLMITFDAYQVASYAEGPQEVVIPYSVLKLIIKPDGLLAKYIK